jgi:hypothetical protein
MSINLENLTVKQAKEIASLFNNVPSQALISNPFIGKRVVVRTYSAGVHIGTLVKSEGMECHLKDGLRLWEWTGGGLSLSAIAKNGIKGGRLNRTSEVYLTQAIEYIPIGIDAEKTFENFIEDEIYAGGHVSGDDSVNGSGNGNGDGGGYGE